MQPFSLQPSTFSLRDSMDWGREIIYRASTNDVGEACEHYERYEIRQPERSAPWFLLAFRGKWSAEKRRTEGAYRTLTEAKAAADALAEAFAKTPVTP